MRAGTRSAVWLEWSSEVGHKASAQSKEFVGASTQRLKSRVLLEAGHASVVFQQVLAISLVGLP